MKLLVLGASGQLGSDIVVAARDERYTVVAATRAMYDVTDPAAIAAAVETHAPDVLVNCAAWTAVDAAEKHPDQARAVNTDAPAHIASVCAQLGVRMCQISTDYVFDGAATAPIPEDATPHPLSVYGQTKLDGELAVRARCADHLIVRTSWLYGGSGPNFVLTMLRLIDEGKPLRVVADQSGAPTWTGHLAPAVLRLVSDATPGTYHLTNSGETTWHGLASAIVAELGLDIEVTPLRSDEYPVLAHRPRYSVLDNAAWRALGEPALPDWREGLKTYLNALSRAREVIAD